MRDDTSEEHEPHRGDDAIKALWLLVSTGSCTTADVARCLGRDDEAGRRRARAVLRQVERCAPVRHVGEGRGRRWIVDPLRVAGVVTAVDQVALRVGRDALSFLQGTMLREGLDRAVLDGEDRRQPYRSLERKFVHLGEPQPLYEEWSEQIDAVVDGLARERRLTLCYNGDSARVHRDIEPLSLVVYRRALYLLARARGEPSILRLRVDRMGDVEVGQPFDYPADWNPEEELRPWFGIVAEPAPELVVLRFSPKVARYVHERRWHPTARVDVGKDGWAQLEMRVGGRELVRFALEWGQHCVVVAPEWLRREVREAHEEALRGST
jgi:predicted DNA-binding transcriptional regulator YafY